MNATTHKTSQKTAKVGKKTSAKRVVAERTLRDA